MRLLAIPFLVIASGCSSAQEAPPADRWHQLAAEGDRLTSTFQGMVWEQRMLSTHNGFWADIYRACAPQAKRAGIESFKAVAVIDSSGVVKEYLLNPSSPQLACFANRMVGRKYPAPPSAPFYEVYTVKVASP